MSSSRESLTGRAALVAAAFLGALALGLTATPVSGGEAVAPERVEASQGSCVESATVLCLQEGRYAVTVGYRTSPEAALASAKVARPRTSDSGLFYFFEPNNWEMLLKVLDGCGNNTHHWVFAASATDQGFELTVRDTTMPEGAPGSMKVYTKEHGPAAPAITDVGAFPAACESSS